MPDNVTCKPFQCLDFSHTHTAYLIHWSSLLSISLSAGDIERRPHRADNECRREQCADSQQDGIHSGGVKAQESLEVNTPKIQSCSNDQCENKICFMAALLFGVFSGLVNPQTGCPLSDHPPG